jgi:hypothetical protein
MMRFKLSCSASKSVAFVLCEALVFNVKKIKEGVLEIL